ncbi:TPA: DUF87 domain-containing protein [Listeria monocytogenes]|nr:DUF87 domain-containing protein [Listeria monocytogenes]
MGLFQKTLTKEEEIDKQGFYAPFIAAIQPQGGITFRLEKVVQKGSSYEAIYHVTVYPSEANLFWLEGIMGLDDIVVTTDVKHIDKEEAKDSIGNIIEEYLNRAYTEKKERGRVDASLEYNEIKDLYELVSKNKEVMKRIILRLFITSPTIHDLEQRIRDVQTSIETEGFQADVFSNETEYEYLSKFVSFSEQESYPNKRYGQPIQASALALGVPFTGVSLRDPRAIYWGESRTGGPIFWDVTHVDKFRKSFDIVGVGKKGAGKSTTIKKLTDERLMKGDYIRALDVTGEYTEQAIQRGGTVISMDGSSGVLNILEIMRTGETNSVCWSLHTTKLKQFYKQINQNASENELSTFSEVATDLYKAYGLYLPTDLEEINMVNRPSTDYPILSDLREHVRQVLYKNGLNGHMNEDISLSKQNYLENIETTINDLISNYGNMFNSHSTIQKIEDIPFVVFNMQNVVDMEIFPAQLFNILYLNWRGMFHIGGPQLEMYRRNEIDLEDVHFYFTVFDEAHHILNTRYPDAIKQLKKFSREGRKYFAGLWLFTQNITDLVPSNGADQSSEVVRDIISLLEMAEYKMIMQQDPNSMDVVRNVFKNTFSESELQAIPQLEQGEMILSLSTVKNIRFSVHTTAKQRAIYGGGVGA